MSKPLKPKRGTTAENDAYIGEAYEVTLDTEKHTLRVHDGVTPGGHEMASGAALDDLSEEFNTNVGTIREDTVAAAQDAARASAGESGTVTLEGVAAEVAHLGAEVAHLGAELGELEGGVGRASAYITETWISGTEWYRKWSDGWIEQGGRSPIGSRVTVTLHKPMSNSNYTPLLGPIGGENTPVSRGIEDMTTTSFKIKIGYNADLARESFWFVCGY